MIKLVHKKQLNIIPQMEILHILHKKLIAKAVLMPKLAGGENLPPAFAIKHLLQ